jgi:2',3'-cyclic-nucleotide 2'-phosphodiesterase
MGTPGMDVVGMFLPSLAREHAADLVIANGENAMDGKSISEAQMRRLYELGVKVITSGNHIWEKWHIHKLLAAEQNLLRPANYPTGNAGRGYTIVDLGAKGKVGVLNLQGRAFLNPIDCPFKTADWAIGRMQDETRCIIVDMHAEATAEKIAMGWYLDGRVSAVVGTHTHVQTADARVLPGGTAYITDVGMTGPYDSVVGMKKDIAIKRFTKQTPHKFESATEDVHVAAVVVVVDAATGRAESITPLFHPEFQRNASEHH